MMLRRKQQKSIRILHSIEKKGRKTPWWILSSIDSSLDGYVLNYKQWHSTFMFSHIRIIFITLTESRELCFLYYFPFFWQRVALSDNADLVNPFFECTQINRKILMVCNVFQLARLIFIIIFRMAIFCLYMLTQYVDLFSFSQTWRSHCLFITNFPFAVRNFFLI